METDDMDPQQGGVADVFVLLDIEWIEADSKTVEITQMTALRVNTSWEAAERFGAIACPASLSACDPSHIAFSGHLREEYEQGEQESGIMLRFSEWLREDDNICVWHNSAGNILNVLWKRHHRSAFPQPVFPANRKVCCTVQDGVNELRSLYYIAEIMGISPSVPHCASDDAELMREVFSAVGLSQKKLRKQSEKTEQTQTEYSGSRKSPVR